MAANKNLSCSKCGKRFADLVLIRVLAAVVGIYFFSMFFLNIFVLDHTVARDKLSILEPIMPFGMIYIAVGFILLIIILPILMAMVAPALDKSHKVRGVLACKDCRDAIEREKIEAENSQKAAQELKANAFKSRLDDMEKNDPFVGKLLKAWKKDHPGMLPEEIMVNELVQARNMEKAGNYEKAAVILEKYHFYEEAGRMRKLDDQTVVKHITVNMNELIDQIATKGLAIPYKCSSCGASITIDKNSKTEGLKFCSYCGTSYNVEDMTKIIQHALE